MFSPVGFLQLDVVKTNLLWWIDFSDPTSYPTTGTSVINLTGGSNGTIQNTPVYSSDFGGTMNFDGVDDYVDFGDTTFHDGAPAFTIHAAVRPGSSAILSAGDVSIVRKFTAGAQTFSLGGPGGASQPYASVRTLIRGNLGSLNSHSSANMLALDTWVFVTSRWNGDNSMTYFKNDVDWGVGIYNARQTPGVLNNSLEHLTIGARYNNNSEDRFWNGDIALVMFYDRALTDEEILHNYNTIRPRYML